MDRALDRRRVARRRISLLRPRRHDAIYRIAAHAATLTEPWYLKMREALTDVAYVEVVAIACTVVAVIAFRRAAGLEPWELSGASRAASRHDSSPTIWSTPG